MSTFIWLQCADCGTSVDSNAAFSIPGTRDALCRKCEPTHQWTPTEWALLSRVRHLVNENLRLRDEATALRSKPSPAPRAEEPGDGR